MTATRKNPRIKRLIEWIIFYVLVIVTFLMFIYMQAKDVNTLGFTTGQIDLTTSKSKYTVSDSISYTITNNLASSIVIDSSCPSEPLHIYKWDNSTWTRIHDTASITACGAIPTQQSLVPGTSVTRTFDAWKIYSRNQAFTVLSHLLPITPACRTPIFKL